MPAVAGIVPKFQATIFEVPNSNSSGALDKLRLDLSGNPFSVTLPSVPGFYAYDANAQGLVAGTCNTSYFGAGNSACVYVPATGVVTEVAGGTSGAYNVNDSGDVLWGPEDPRTGNQTTELHIRKASGMDLRLGFTSYWRPSFNSQHDVVGRLYGGAAFYVFDDIKYDLQSLVLDMQGLRELAPTDINDAGMIVGWAFYGQSEVRGFVLKPTSDATVPEPGTWAVVGIGLLALSLSRRRGTALHDSHVPRRPARAVAV